MTQSVKQFDHQIKLNQGHHPNHLLTMADQQFQNNRRTYENLNINNMMSIQA